MGQNIIRANEMKLGDIVRLNLGYESPYADMTVRQIEGGRVHLFRPYVQCANFTYTGGVITYIGHEDMTVDVSASTTFVLLSRRDPEETRNKIAAIVANIRQLVTDGKNAQALEALRQL